MIGSQILHYRIVEKLGEGGMGVVYRAEDTKLHRDVALKFLPDEALEREEDRARFIAEARAAAALDHPNICTVFDINETDGHYFIAMAFVGGRELRQIVTEDGPLPVLDALRITEQVAEGLGAAHEKGIVHRDIKSANVMITARGQARIMDFGLAQRTVDDRSPASATTGGTIAYASPEQVRAEPLDHRTDIWSAGVMLYEMLTGRLPFGGDYESAIVYSILNETPPPPSSLRDDLPGELDRIVANALAKRPEDRYQSADEMAAELMDLRRALDPNISRAAGFEAGAPARSNPWQRVAVAGAVWLGLTWVVAKLTGLVVSAQQLSPHLTTMATVAMLALLPAVGVVAYFSAQRGHGRWGRPEWIGVPTNAVLAVALLYIAFSGKDLGAAMRSVEVTNEDGEKIERMIPKGSFRKNFSLYAFENASGDEALDWLQYAMPALLTSDLYQDAFVTARPPFDPTAYERLQQAGFSSWVDAPPGLKRQIASELHDAQYVTATVDKEGTGYRMNVRVHDTGSGRVIDEKSYLGDDVFTMADKIAVDLKQAVGVPAWHLDGAPDLPVGDMLTSSVDALREYTMGLTSIVFDEDWEGARAHLDAAVASDSTMAYAHFYRFLALRMTNDYAGAQGALQDALRHTYKVPERFQFIIKGNYYFLRQEPDKALALFEMAAELYPDDIQSFQALAQIYSLRNEVDKAIAAYERILELDPFQYDHLLMLASLYVRKGDYDHALECKQKYAGLNPKDPRSFQELAELYEDMGQWDNAQENIDKALLLDPERVTLLIGAGNIKQGSGDFDGALEHYGEALKYARSSTDSVRVLAAFEGYYQLRGEFNKAIEYLDERLAKDPAPLSRYGDRLGELDMYVHAGRSDEAFSILDETRGVFSTPPMSYMVSRGEAALYNAQERPDELEAALDGFEQYIESFRIDVLRPTVEFARGRVLELRGDLDGAVAAYRAVIADNPGHASMHRALGRCLRELGRLDEAKAELERSRTLFPASGSTHYELAVLLEALGDHPGARKSLDRALVIWESADPAYSEAARARALADAWDAAASM